MAILKVRINGVEAPSSSTLHIQNTDRVFFSIDPSQLSESQERLISLILEDQQIPITITQEGFIQTENNTFFWEMFGYCSVKLVVNNAVIDECAFNVATTKERFESVKSMLVYLKQNNKRILGNCFSKSDVGSVNNNGSSVFELYIALAEKIIAVFTKRDKLFLYELRSSYVTTKEQPNKINNYSFEPFDVIDNLHELTPGYSENSMKINGRLFSLEGLARQSSSQSYDVEENQVVLAGLMSVRHTLLYIKSEIERSLKTKEREATPKHYENLTAQSFSIEDLHSQLLAGDTLERISNIMLVVDELIYTLSKQLSVSFNGFKAPKVTSFVRRSSLYFTAYQLLKDWYELGQPGSNSGAELTKIKSVSRIFEFFVLYKLIEAMLQKGWVITEAVQHSIFGNLIPSTVRLKKNDVLLDIDYEKRIYTYNVDTQHKQIVAIPKLDDNHGSFDYYTPDFLLSRNKDGEVDYFIIDAKYSSASTLERYGVLDSLYEKYYSGLGVYDKNKGVLHKDSILAIYAVHAFGRSFLSKWLVQGPRLVPDVSSLLLSEGVDKLSVITELIEL